MGTIVIIMVIVVCGGVIWWRRRSGASSATAPTESLPRENFALKAFAHGNTCLAEGKFDEAIASFHEARELDSKQPHIEDRLAEVERQRQAADAITSDKLTG